MTDDLLQMISGTTLVYEYMFNFSWCYKIVYDHMSSHIRPKKKKSFDSGYILNFFKGW